jgi:hypothetical protein
MAARLQAFEAVIDQGKPEIFDFYKIGETHIK